MCVWRSCGVYGVFVVFLWCLWWWRVCGFGVCDSGGDVGGVCIHGAVVMFVVVISGGGEGGGVKAVVVVCGGAI